MIVDSGPAGRATRGTGTTVAKVHEARVSYDYRVGERSYTCDRIEFLYLRSNSGNHRRALLDRCPPGAGVDVHFNPRRPGQAVLRPGMSAGAWFALAFFALTLSILATVIHAKLPG